MVCFHSVALYPILPWKAHQCKGPSHFNKDFATYFFRNVFFNVAKDNYIVFPTFWVGYQISQNRKSLCNESLGLQDHSVESSVSLAWILKILWQAHIGWYGDVHYITGLILCTLLQHCLCQPNESYRTLDMTPNIQRARSQPREGLFRWMISFRSW